MENLKNKQIIESETIYKNKKGGYVTRKELEERSIKLDAKSEKVNSDTIEALTKVISNQADHIEELNDWKADATIVMRGEAEKNKRMNKNNWENVGIANQEKYPRE